MLSPKRIRNFNTGNNQYYHSRTADNTLKKKTPIEDQERRYSSRLYLWGSFHNDQNIADISKAHYLLKMRNCGVVNASCGKNHVGLISKKGELYMLGSNNKGQLGVDGFSTPHEQEYTEKPCLLSSLFYKGLTIEQVSCGYSHTLALATNGKVFSWGSNEFGQLGLGSIESKPYPMEIPMFSNSQRSYQEVISIQCGANHSGLLDHKGDLYLWGAGELGQLGTSSRMNEVKPHLIKWNSYTKRDDTIKQMALGHYHTCILTEKGRVLQTGQIVQQQQPSQQSNNYYTSFVEVITLQNFQDDKAIQSIKAKSISAGLTVDGKVVTWVDNYQKCDVFDEFFVDDFELCQDDYIVLRKQSQFFKYQSKSKKLELLELGSETRRQMSSLTILTCGDNYIMGVITRKKHSSRLTKSSDRLHSSQKKYHKSNLHRYQKSLERIAQDVNNHRTHQTTNNSQLNSHRDQQPQTLQHNYSEYNIGVDKQSDRPSTQIRKISSHQRLTRAGSNVQDNIQYSNYTLNEQNMNSNSKLHQNKLSQSTNSYYAMGAPNQKPPIYQQQQQQKSVIYDNEELASNASFRNSNDQQKQYDPIQQSYPEYQHKKKESRVCFTDQTNQIIPLTGSDSPNKSQANYNLDNAKSLRISYDEQRLANAQSDLARYSHKQDTIDEEEWETENLRSNNHLVYEALRNKQNRQDESNLNHLLSQTTNDYQYQPLDDQNSNVKSNALSERKQVRSSKEQLKQALKQEIKLRLSLEQQLFQLQQQFDAFKQDIGIEQMKQVLAESQTEYQKLYDICVQECEKSTRHLEFYKKERKLREDIENQLIQLGDQELLLKNQIQHLESQLSKLREDKMSDQQSLKQTVLDQQRVIEELRVEKERQREKIFDMEESVKQMRNCLMVEKQQSQVMQQQNKDYQQEIARIEEERSQMEEENQRLEQSLKQKNDRLKDYDGVLVAVKEREKELLQIIERLNEEKNQIKKQEFEETLLSVQTIQNEPENVSVVQQAVPQQRERNASINSTASKQTSQTNLKGKVLNSARQDSLQKQVQNPKIISQTNKHSVNTSAYSTRKANHTNPTQTQKQPTKSTSNLKQDRSPDKLQQKTSNDQKQHQDLSSKKFIADAPKTVNQPQNIKHQDVSQLQTTPSQQSKQPLKQQQQQSRSNSPLDYLGLKPKQKQSSFQPRLSGITGSQTQRSASNNSTAFSKQQIQLSLNQTRNQVLGISPDELATPSQYSLTITPILQNSSSNANITPFGGVGLIDSLLHNNTLINQSMFDQQHDDSRISLMTTSSNNTSKKILGSSSTTNILANPTPQAALSKSFDGLHQSHHNRSGAKQHSTHKKQVKFQLDSSQQQLLFDESQTKENTSEIILTTQEDDNKQQKQKQQEAEIEKLYESLTSDMKSLKNANVDNLKGKLEAIRRNKVILEDKIKEYEKKLGK